MTATVTTKQIKDPRRRHDFPAAGARCQRHRRRPFLPLSTLAYPEGTAPIDLAALIATVVDALASGVVLGAGTDVVGKVGLQAGGSDVSAANPLPIGNAQIATITATIASGASLSDAADLGTGRLVGLIMPAGWTTASLTFQGSADGSTYFDLYDDATERAISSSSVVASRFLAMPVADWLMVRAIKLRSGSAATPVNQSAERAITLVTAR